jgi:hypothetical protein
VVGAPRISSIFWFSAYIYPDEMACYQDAEVPHQ